MKVYLININDTNENIFEISDERFKSLAKVVGKVLSIKKFEDIFNFVEIDVDTDVIRFLGKKKKSKFPNGFTSWAHTYGVMCDTVQSDPFNEGRIALLERLKGLATEFEQKYNVPDEYWEENQWDEVLEKFLTKKLSW